MLLLVGTKKGAFVFTSDRGRKSWKMAGPFHQGKEIYRVTYDRRDGTIFASVNDNHWGPTVARSRDMGKRWKISKTPPKFTKGSGMSVERIWQIVPGFEDEPDTLYAGTAPACLFRSDDGGEHWTPNEAMLNHKTRRRWQPGAGGMCLHTILLDRRRPKRVLVAISAVGTMRSEDEGASWKFQNKNVLADFLPNKYPEYGQCVHKLAYNPGSPDVIYQQNHCGVFRTDDAGENWKDIRDNLPSRFGFPVAVDANQTRRVYVVPLEGDFSRIPPEGHFAVWASDQGGGDWVRLDNGIPKISYYTVLRDGMSVHQEDPGGLYFGTTTGHLFGSRDQGNSWERVTDGLPPILSVSASPA